MGDDGLRPLPDIRGANVDRLRCCRVVCQDDTGHGTRRIPDAIQPSIHPICTTMIFGGNATASRDIPRRWNDTANRGNQEEKEKTKMVTKEKHTAHDVEESSPNDNLNGEGVSGLENAGGTCTWSNW